MFLLAALLVWGLGTAAVFGWLSPALLPLASACAVVLPLWRLARGWPPGTRAAALASALVFLVSTANLRSMTAPDTQPASEQPWTLLRHGTLFLDAAPVLREHPAAHWIYTRPDGRRASWYPPGMALLATPLYLPAALARAPSAELLSAFEKWAAAALSALTALLLGLALARAGQAPRQIFLAVILYGLCSSALSLLSQALWQQTGCALAVALILFASLSPEARGSGILALLSGAILAATRPPDVLLVLPFLLAARSRRLWLWTAAGLALGALVFLGYNQLVFGSPWAIGYQVGQKQLGFTLSELPESTFGLFFSPGHGLLVFLPWLLLLPLCAPRRDQPIARAALLGAVILVAVMSTWWCWWGADSFGPRMLSEVQVALVFSLALGMARLPKAARAALVALALLSFATHAAYPFWLARDPSFDPSAPWRARAHPLGHWLLPPDR